MMARALINKTSSTPEEEFKPAKTMNKNLAYVVMVLASYFYVFIGLFVGYSFAQWNVNPSEWPLETRGTFAAMWMFCGMVLSLVTITSQKKSV
jgi:hypothetical protein